MRLIIHGHDTTHLDDETDEDGHDSTGDVGGGDSPGRVGTEPPADDSEPGGSNDNAAAGPDSTRTDSDSDSDSDDDDDEDDMDALELTDGDEDPEAIGENAAATATAPVLRPTATTGRGPPLRGTSRSKHLRHRNRPRSGTSAGSMGGCGVGVMLVLRKGDAVRSPLPQLPRDPVLGGDLLDPHQPRRSSPPLEHFESLLCDCEASALIVDDDDPLNLGREKRCATPHQRRAIIERDGGCTFPGCECPVAWVEIHHVRLWADGGTTDIIYLPALCRRHHGITHRKGWTMHTLGDGWFWWTTPSGSTSWSQRHGRQRTGPAPDQHLDIAS